jgi:hypothetical protein
LFASVLSTNWVNIKTAMQLFVNFLIIRTYGEESIQLFTATNNRVDHNVARHSLCLLRRQKETQCVCETICEHKLLCRNISSEMGLDSEALEK